MNLAYISGKGNITKNVLVGLSMSLVFALGVAAWAQVAGSVVGVVQDTSGAVIPGATVTVKNRETGVARPVTTDDRGNYRALSLPVGVYDVSAEKTGFKTQVRAGINLVVGQEAVVNLNMEVGEVQQQVTVTAEAPIVNTTTAATGGLVGERQIKDLPLNGRSYDNLLTLNPGIINSTSSKKSGTSIQPGNQFNVAGRRYGENLFLLNGIEYTGAGFSGNTPGGTSGQLLGIDAVREFNVQTDTYGAEYGKRAGGQISVVTMSGGNQFHGTAFEFLRNSYFDARNFFDISKPEFRRNDFGGAAGGPIRKDKMFLFGNYEALRQSLTTTNIAFVPDDDARRGFLPTGPGGSLVNVGLAPGVAPYFALWPEPNGPKLTGGIAESIIGASNPVREDFGTVRFDNNFSEKDSFSSVYTINDGTSTTPTVNIFVGLLLTVRNQVSSVEETHTFSPNVINTARIGYSRAYFLQFVPPLISLPENLSMVEGKPMGTVNIGTSVSGTSAISGFTANPGNLKIRNLFSYSDTLQIVKGKHLITAGAWFQRLQSNTTNGDSWGSVTFSGLPAFLQGTVSQFSASGNGGIDYGLRQWEASWFVQDTIKVLPNLTINLGLRHEFTNLWNEVAGRFVNWIQGPDGVILNQPLIGHTGLTENNAKWLFSPRFGLAWDPFGKGKTSIHAGIGIYYDLLDDLDAAMVGTAPLVQSFQLSNVQFPYHFTEGSPFPLAAVPIPKGLPPAIKTPKVEEWHFQVEQQLAPSTVLSLSYVGSHGYRFIGTADGNPTQSVICPTTLATCPTGVPDGTRFFPLGAPKLNPKLGAANSFFAQYGINNFNSLQVDIRQRLSKGVTFRANYSYSKAMDNASGTSSNFASNCPTIVMELNNPRRDYSRSCIDVTHRFAFNGSYDLPIGRGRALLGGLNGLGEKLLAGWKLNGIFGIQSGFPFAPLVGFSNSRDGKTNSADRPSVNPNFSGPVILGKPTRWYDPRYFILPPAGTYGDVSRNSLSAPGLVNVDASLFKETRFSERFHLEFRAEIFNLFNHANFGLPGSAVLTTSGAPAGSAGVITSTSTTSRQIQLGMKLIW